MPNIWPELLIFVCNAGHERWGMDNIFATFEHTDRIYQLSLFDIPSSQSEKVLAEMQRPFPALTTLFLEFHWHDETPPVAASFLGGSAPLLQSLYLDNVPFPGLPKLLLSATHLVDLILLNLPYSGHFSTEVLVTCLSALTRLESLRIGFKSPRSRPGRTSQHPPPRTLLPFLTHLLFKGVCEYLEDLVARIDAPLLDKLEITFFHQLIFDTPELAQFIYRAPKLKAQNGARLYFTTLDVRVTFPHTNSQIYSALNLKILCSHPDWQLSSLAQVSSSLPWTLIHTVEDLYISDLGFPRVPWQDDLENSQWLELLHPFTAVKDLKLSWNFMRHIAPALQELVGDRTMEVLPALRALSIDMPHKRDVSNPEFPFASGLVRCRESLEQFIRARKLASHPINVRKNVSNGTHRPPPPLPPYAALTIPKRSARVAITSGPAAAAAEIRKNKKKRAKISAADPPPDAKTADALSDTLMSVAGETTLPGVLTQSIRPFVSYPSSVMSPTPSPINAELFTGDRSPSPTPHSSLQKRLTAAAGRSIPPSNRAPPRGPIDKYTCANMPQIYDAHPTALLDHISIDLIGKWEKLSGGKLLAIPFDDVALHIAQHETVKGQIFTAVAEITQSQEASVLTPKQRQGMKETPTSFLIYNLTEAECTLLLERRVWSSPAITFRVSILNPPCPDFLFQIKGFSTLVTNDILETVRTVWQSKEADSLIKAVADTFPAHEYDTVTTSITTFLNSMRVTRLDTKSSDDSLQPRFNVYASGSEISNNEAWLFLRDSLASYTYETLMKERGETLTVPFNCGLCHGVDHPRALCPFPLVPGWNGPGHHPQSTSQRGRGGKARSLTIRGRR